jgi:hypothetical protein
MLQQQSQTVISSRLPSWNQWKKRYEKDKKEEEGRRRKFKPNGEKRTQNKKFKGKPRKPQLIMVKIYVIRTQPICKAETKSSRGQETKRFASINKGEKSEPSNEANKTELTLKSADEGNNKLNLEEYYAELELPNQQRYFKKFTILLNTRQEEQILAIIQTDTKLLFELTQAIIDFVRIYDYRRNHFWCLMLLEKILVNYPMEVGSYLNTFCGRDMLKQAFSDHEMQTEQILEKCIQYIQESKIDDKERFADWIVALRNGTTLPMMEEEKERRDLLENAKTLAMKEED